jgi:hypothetical protein
VRVHHFHHRYARGNRKETAKEQLTYHAALLLEWSHGRFMSVVELATLNGIGGRLGKSNWYHDKQQARPKLYQKLPACMVAPWMGQFAEIRCSDIPLLSPDPDVSNGSSSSSGPSFVDFLRQYTGMRS